MSLRRSGRSRNPTDEGSDVKPVPGIVDATRKRRRVSDETSKAAPNGSASSTEASKASAASATLPDTKTPEPAASPTASANGTAGLSPSAATSPGRLRGRLRVRPSKAGHDAPAVEVAEKVNGSSSASERRRTTRGADGSHDGMQETTGPQHASAPNQAPSTSKASPSRIVTEELADSAHDASDELPMDAEDAAKLGLVLEWFAPDLLARPLAPLLAGRETDDSRIQNRSPSKGKQRHSSTLRHALNAGKTSLRQFRSSLLALQTLTLEQPAGADDGDNHGRAERKDTMASLSLVLGLVDEIAKRQPATQDTTSSLRPVKAEDNNQGDAACEALVDAWEHGHHSERPQQYSLHLRLPMGDYFSRAVELSPDEIARLETGLADLVAVEPQLDSKSVGKQPTLGERLYRSYSRKVPSVSTQELRETRLGKVVPTLGLYYGPFASFAPSYDSSASSISQAASNLIWSTKTDATSLAHRNAWHGHPPRNASPDSDADHLLEPPPPPACGDLKGQDVDSLLEGLDHSLDADLLRSVLRRADEQDALDTKLDNCARLLWQLRTCQEDRLRALYFDVQGSRGTAGQAPASRFSVAHATQPDAKEEAVAGKVLSELSSMIRMRPRELGSPKPTLIPTGRDLQALSRSADIDPAFLSNDSNAATPGYWGTLDPALYAPQAPQQLAGKISVIVPTFSSNETVRLDPSGEHRAINRSLRQRGLPIGVSRDHGPGLLDRVAEVDSRNRHAGATMTLNGMNALLPPPVSNPYPASGPMPPPTMGPVHAAPPPGFPMHGSPPFTPMPVAASFGYHAGSPPLPAAMPVPLGRSAQMPSQQGTPRTSGSGQAGNSSSHRRSAGSPLAGAQHRSQQNLRPSDGPRSQPSPSLVRPY
ncbi:unnamed protein product [Parajaminaea phylloscopi]